MVGGLGVKCDSAVRETNRDVSGRLRRIVHDAAHYAEASVECTAPAIASDGTLYTVSRAHFVTRYNYLIAVNPNLTGKWAASLRGRLDDRLVAAYTPASLEANGRIYSQSNGVLVVVGR